MKRIALHLNAILLVCAMTTSVQGQQSSRRDATWQAPASQPSSAQSSSSQPSGSLSSRLRRIQGAGQAEQPAAPVANRVLPPADRGGTGGLRSVLKRTNAGGTAAPIVPPSPGEPGALHASIDNESRNIRVASRPLEPLEPSTPAPTDAGQTFQSPSGNFVPATEKPAFAPAAAGSTQTVASQGAQLRVTTVAPRSVVLGKESSWEVVVVNEGSTPAQQVVVQATLPTTATLSNSTASAGEATQATSGADQVVQWQIPTVSAGSEVRLKLGLIPQEAQALQLQVTWAVQPQVMTAQVEVQQPLLELEVGGPAEMKFGESSTFTLVLANPGTGPAENVTIQLNAGGSQTQPRQIGTLAAGQRQTIELDLSANQAGNLLVTALATASNDLEARAEHQVVVRKSELAVRLVGPERTFAGTPATYELRVSNSGDAAAEDTVAGFALPEGTKVLAATKGSDVEQNQLQWAVGNLPEGTERVFQVRCELTQSGTNQIEGAAMSAGGEQVSDLLTTKVEIVADLKLTVNDPEGPQAVGAEVSYEIIITNRGSKAATNVDVVAQFSEGVEPTSAAGQEGEIVPGQVVFDTLPQIAPGQTVKLTVHAKADADGPHRFRAEVISPDNDTQLATEETTRFYQ